MRAMGLAQVIRINVDWYTKRERGTFSAIFGIMISSGYFASLGLGGLTLSTAGPAACFFVPAAATFVTVDLTRG